MFGLTDPFFLAAVVLCAAQLICGYGYRNCIAEPYMEGKSFHCVNRKEDNMSVILRDLPPSAINLSIYHNPLWLISNYSFVHLPKLKHLRVDCNQLKIIGQFAFQNLNQLRSLNLSFNLISQLHPFLFKDLHNLTVLSLTHNRLKQLPEGLFNNLNLRKLIMRQNNLTNFSHIAESVSHLMNLKELDLHFNHFRSLFHLNVSLPTSLTVLYMSGNQLSTLGCERSFLEHIQVLDLSYNSMLPTMAFLGVDLRQIQYLRLRSTRVEVLELFKISDIKPDVVDFSGTGLKNESQLTELCRLMQGRRVKSIKSLRLNANGIERLTNETLSYCPKIRENLALSQNELKSTGCLNFLNRQTRIKSFTAEHNHLTTLQSCSTSYKLYFLEELSYRYNRILSVNANAFHHTPNIKTLQLNINTIAFLHRQALKGLKKLEVLRLDNNLLTDLFNDTFEDNSKLQILNLRNNRISVIFNGTFRNLSNLTTLDLGGNKITHFKASGLDGLVSLSKFYLDGNNLKQIDTPLYRAFQDMLTVLDLQGNKIHFQPSNSCSPFVNFSKLSDLKLDGQLPHGLSVLPQAFFKGLHSLKSLYLTNNNLFLLSPNAFDDLTSLQFLTLENCCVGVAHLQPGIFKNLRNLTRLVTNNMGLQNFSKEVFGNLTQLRILQMDHNVMQSIDVDALQRLNKLSYLDIQNIPLSCTCQNSLLQNWTVSNTKVQVVYLQNLQCQNTNAKFYNFDTKVCYMDLGQYMFFSTAIVIFTLTVCPLLYVKLYWKIKYSYYVFRAWFSEQWHRLREEEENCKYDAFISYNSSDEQWIMDQLVPNLEGNGSSFKLCLHHRDFELGRYIVDNIVSAVYSSRKTICVVSSNFLQSEWCSLEMQLASYRLFDEHRDVLLLVFLEPISQRHLSSYHRMRKVMLKKTYLQWPTSDCSNPMQAQDLFWHQLRRAMRTGSRLDTEVKTKYHDVDTAVSEEAEHFGTSDDNCNLLA